MPSPFPGMDPYLEDPRFWPGVHNRFVVYLADALQTHLRPRYLAAVEERVYIERPNSSRSIIPDAWIRRSPPRGHTQELALSVIEADEPIQVWEPRTEIHESYLTLLDRQSGQEVVTVIELLSPSNKTRGPGRVSYLDKQAEVLASRAHLVEIDLLRQGPHTLAVSEAAASGTGPRASLVCVNRAGGWRERFELYPRTLRDRLPRVRIPLAEGDPDAVLDLQGVFTQTFDSGAYADRIDYGHPCLPPLDPADQAWADGLTQAANP